MDSIAHISQAHIDRMLLRLGKNSDFQNEIEFLKGDSSLDEKVQSVLGNSKLMAILQNCVEFFDFKLKKLETDHIRPRRLRRTPLQVQAPIGCTFNIHGDVFIFLKGRAS